MMNDDNVVDFPEFEPIGTIQDEIENAIENIKIGYGIRVTGLKIHWSEDGRIIGSTFVSEIDDA